MTIAILATVVRVSWLVIEYPYLRRHRVAPAKDWDRHSAKLWDAANAVEPVGMVIGFAGVGRIQTGTDFIGVLWRRRCIACASRSGRSGRLSARSTSLIRGAQSARYRGCIERFVGR